MTLDLNGRVAIVTGAGAGLGRAHALGLAARGARVLINDVSAAAAEAVAAEIEAAGGEALPNAGSVTDEAAVGAMVSDVLSRWGQADILVNNAGILRDRSFAKMTLEEFRSVLDVHLTGAFLCSHAVWEPMRRAGYGRIVMTTSTSGLYGQFGQANYGAAKAGLVGLMNVLAIEGARYGIKVNALSPTALTAMTEGILPEAAARSFAAESVTPALLALCAEEAPTKTVLAAGAGTYGATLVLGTRGVHLSEGDRTPEAILARLAEITSQESAEPFAEGAQQAFRYLALGQEEAG